MDKNEIIDYFMSNIFEALSARTVWQCLAYSRAVQIVGEQMANKYVEIQKIHYEFFGTVEQACLLSFVIKVLHPFDKDNRSYSLYEVDKVKTEEFVFNNKEVLEQLFAVRNKVFAHRDKEVTKGKLKDYGIIPSMNKLDVFFGNLINLYNELSKEVNGSYTIFSNATNVKHDVEDLFMNVSRGEDIRKKEIDIEWMWKKDDNQISKKIKDIK